MKLILLRWARVCALVSFVLFAFIEQARGAEQTFDSSISAAITAAAQQHTANFMVNGTAFSSVSVEEGSAITFPAVPETIAGKMFVGWVTAAIDGVSEKEPEALVTSATMGAADVTYYAVYATQVSAGTLATVTDVLTREVIGSTGSSYTDWSGKTSNSDAVYAGNSAGGSGSIQLRTTQSNSGIVSITSGGKLAKITVEWNNDNTNGRSIYIYGSNTAYSSASNLYDSAKKGTYLGKLTYNINTPTSTTTELIVDGEYTYVGIRASSGTIYLNSISIYWENGTPAIYTGYCTTVTIPVTVTISAAGYSTLYYGTKNLIVPTGMEAYTVKVTTQVERSKTYNAGDVIPAGTGVVLHAEAGTYTFNVSTSAGEADANNMLRGSDEKATTTGGTYYYALTLNANKDIDSAGFYWMVAGGGAYQAGAHKAYLALNQTFTELANGSTNGVKGFLALPEADTDAINAIDNGQLTVDSSVIYNIAGQRINKLQRGVNIVNGKKVLVK